jgi:hypothetical protein
MIQDQFREYQSRQRKRGELKDKEERQKGESFELYT